MGTNFYTLKGVHVGKRSAVGRYCWGSSFSWAMKPEKFKASKIKVIKNEYGEKFSREVFDRDILAECPIKYTTMVGQEFS